MSKFRNFLFNSAVLLGISCFFFLYQNQRFKEQSLGGMLVISSAIVAFYGGQRLYKLRLKELPPPLMERLIPVQNYLQLNCVMSALVALVGYALYPIQMHYLALLPLSIGLTLAYVFFRFREIPYLKALLVAIVWTMLFSVHLADQIDALLIVADGLLFFSLAIVADLKDAPYDHHNMRTLPQVFGSTPTLLLSFLCFTLSQVLHENPFTVNFILIELIYIALLYFHHRNSSRFENYADLVLGVVGG